VAIHYYASVRRLSPTVHRDTTLSRETAREPLCLYQRAGNSNPLTEEIRGNWHHNKNLARGNISSIPLSEELC
jgi:hypothetical protein